MSKKYELIESNISGFYRIKSLKNFDNVKIGDIGGYVEKEDNLSHIGDCWIYDNAIVSGNAMVSGNAIVSDNAMVSGNARVSGDAVVRGNPIVSGNAGVYDDAIISDNAVVRGNAIVSDNAVVYDNPIVSGNARVYDNAIVSGNARVYDNAMIKNTNDYFAISPIGLEDGVLTAYKTQDKNIGITIGCFTGTIEEFIETVNSKYKDTKYFKEYTLALDLMKLKLNNN